MEVKTNRTTTTQNQHYDQHEPHKKLVENFRYILANYVIPEMPRFI